MPRNEKKLRVTFHHQQKEYYCGPATAQMILGWLEVKRLSQDALWAEIQNNSGGVRPVDAPSSPSEFDTQVCYWCAGEWDCWDTTPEALTATVNAHRTNVVQLNYVNTFNDGMNALVASISAAAPVPVAATILGVNHWVVVRGFRLDDQGPSAVNGVYILDPLETNAKVRMRLIPLDVWQELFASMDCGPHTNQRPIVVGA